MTYTKNVGTPLYMAPEILLKEHYSWQADVFSMAVVFYEVMNWETPYNDEIQFKYAWSIAEFVCTGNRLPQTPKISDSMYILITNMWKHQQEDRPECHDILKYFVENKLLNNNDLVETKKELEIETESESESEKVTESEKEIESESETESETESESESESGTESESESETETGTETEESE